MSDELDVRGRTDDQLKAEVLGPWTSFYVGNFTEHRKALDALHELLRGESFPRLIG